VQGRSLQDRRTVEENPRWKSGKKMEKSLLLAAKWHRKQARKKDKEPYLGHLLGVASLVIEYGGTEEQACAALLHDAIEDQKKTMADIKVKTGSAAIARMVNECTESYKIPKGKHKNEVWAERKQWYIDHLRSKPSDSDSILVALADKVNNCEKTLRDFQEYNRNPQRLWRDFNAGDSCQKWWYEQLLEGFASKKLTGPQKRLVARFEEAVTALFGSRQIVDCDRKHQHWHELPKGAK